MTVVGPVLVGLVYVALASLLPEPARQRVNALMLAGAVWLFLGAPSVYGRAVTRTGDRT